jgi:adenylate kinase
MKIALTGTPGTGKSTVAEMVGSGFIIIRVNDLIKEKYNIGLDVERNSWIADILSLSRYINTLQGDMILEGHISHLLPVDVIIVLRASPTVLRKRLASRGWSDMKIKENVEAEALDVILCEAVDTDKKVYEIDTTNMTPMQVKEAVLEIIGGTDNYQVGGVDFSEEAFL